MNSKVEAPHLSIIDFLCLSRLTSNSINNFIEYIKLKDLFFNTKAYSITICNKLNGFTYREGLEVKEYKNSGLSFIINNERFTWIIPDGMEIIRLPNKGGMAKNINLYKTTREKRYYLKTKEKYLKYYGLNQST